MTYTETTGEQAGTEERIKATCNDILAMARGCSGHERLLRKMSPTSLYNGDATFREIMIKLDLIRQTRGVR